MATVKIYGASDDLIEVDGSIPGCDEYSPGRDDIGYVECDTGDVFKVAYTKAGIWRVDHHVKSGNVITVEIVKVPEDEEDPEPYSDVATISGVSWVDCWPEWPPSNEAIRERLDKAFEDGLPAAKAVAIFKLMYGERKWM